MCNSTAKVCGVADRQNGLVGLVAVVAESDDGHGILDSLGVVIDILVSPALQTGHGDALAGRFRCVH